MDSVWFSDESLFVYDNIKGHVWMKIGSKRPIEYIKQANYSHKKAHVWAAISMRGRTELYMHTHT